MLSREDAVAVDTDFLSGLARIWDGSRERHLESVATVRDQLARVIDAEDPAPLATREAEDAAHQLAGTLGVFGLPLAAQRAQEIEQRLRDQVPPTPFGARRLLAKAAEIDRLIRAHEILCEPVRTSSPSTGAG